MIPKTRFISLNGLYPQGGFQALEAPITLGQELNRQEKKDNDRIRLGLCVLEGIGKWGSLQTRIKDKATVVDKAFNRPALYRGPTPTKSLIS